MSQPEDANKTQIEIEIVRPSRLELYESLQKFFADNAPQSCGDPNHPLAELADQFNHAQWAAAALFGSTDLETKRGKGRVTFGIQLPSRGLPDSWFYESALFDEGEEGMARERFAYDMARPGFAARGGRLVRITTYEEVIETRTRGGKGNNICD